MSAAILQKVIDDLIALRQIAEADGHDMLAYLIEIPILEASDVQQKLLAAEISRKRGKPTGD
ncbi:hypothetical protein QFZ34_002197 [Phyllobacterium ifriqiyense]|uniref:Uncharacterized protein n=1 Tax=Phyllobacterium ifriqiyense TaxID=314238 RepID=A0ABU0SAR9_9HYPH|nr:hypothetical protein [Phyllobacterium ifriqiyense]MDQ0997015.1 hypothetical protein [Phyllobacterium ifriqiyense]